ncbi:hypothetical protein QYE76_014703 [Lolium multiflorum]|uniref:MADS-box domain-containing protein n=1 Tax=Lolium multiflorum TaxID=4521 RepID=A0AAD8U306_LOLMU|nr:hypothetical protein QYE76_014703 [Lolium multiflorum]
MAPRRPKGTGRKKIEIRPIESKQARQVCFSKRRVGLFRKAIELATICDAKVGAVAFSPGDNVFTFGHPSVDSVLDRFYSSEMQVAEAAGGGEDGGGDLNQALAEAAGGGDDGGGVLNQALAEAAGGSDLNQALVEAAGDGGGDLNQALEEALGGGDDGGGDLYQALAEALGGGDDGGGDLNQALVEAAGDGGGDLNQALEEALGGGDDGGGDLYQALAEALGGGDDGGGDLNQALVEPTGGDGDLNQALADLNQKQDVLLGRLEAEKAQRDSAEEVVAKARAEGCQTTGWLDRYVIQMGEEDLGPFAAVMAKVHAAAAARAGEVLQQALLSDLTVQGGGGGFEFGGASSGMEMDTETMNKLRMIMTPPPPLPGYAAGTEMTPQGEGFGPHGFPQ